MPKIESKQLFPEIKKPEKKKRLRPFGALFLIFLVIILALTSAYFYKKSRTNPNQSSQAEVASLVEKVGKLVVLPKDETPTIATVSDPEALKGQAFFAEAKKGDKVLIYSNAKKAILYDPILDKIITIAPLNIDMPPTQPETTNTAPAPSPETTPEKKK